MAVTNLIPLMTSNIAPSGVVSAITETSGREAFRIFDQYTLSRWSPSSSITNGWFQYEFDTATVANAYTLTSAWSTYNNYMVKDWTLKASNTGAFGGEEVILDTQSGETAWGDREEREFSFSNTTAYTYYRIHATASNSVTFSVGMMELGTLDGQPPSSTANIEVNAEANAESLMYASASATISVVARAGIYEVNPVQSVFTFVYSLQQAQPETKFKFVYSIEQPKTATIIKRVNS